MKKLINLLIPPSNWQTIAILVFATGIGIVIYLFYASNAVSYLSDNSETCVNCHVMNPQYASWFHSSHREVTNCNDCHVPHDNVLNKYYFKAKDGIRHATAFTLRNEPQVISIKEAGLIVVQENCKRCHLYVNERTSLKNLTGESHILSKEKVCWSCHREVPHGRVNSLSATVNSSLINAVPEIARFISAGKNENK